MWLSVLVFKQIWITLFLFFTRLGDYGTVEFIMMTLKPWKILKQYLTHHKMAKFNG